MAKFAKCGYGSRGQGLGATTDGYTYVVNDNVRTGDTIQVVATSSRGKKFATTAVPLHTYKETSVKGQEARREAQQETGEEPTRSYTGKELGVEASKKVPKEPTIKGEKAQSQYTLQTRAGNIAEYLKNNPNEQLTKGASETFASYSKKFMGKGE